MTTAVHSERRSTVAPLLLLAGLLLLALVLRFYRLGVWNFEATEMFTLRDSVKPQFHNPRPLGYLLNYFLVLPVHPLDEFGLRVMSAIVGTITVAAFYLVARRLIGERAALFGTVFLAVSPLHVYYSQFARYWALVFLFSAIYPYALYLGVRDRSRSQIALGLLTLLLAVLSHPVSAILIGGPALWLAFKYCRPTYLRAAWSRPAVRWGAVGAGLLLLVLAYRLVPLLHGWVTMHDKNPGMGQFLLGPKWANGPKQAVLLMAFVESLTLPVSLAAAAAIYLLWRQRDRSLGAFLASLALFQLAFIALASTRTPVSTFYLVPAAPVFYLGVGLFFDRLSAVEWMHPRWLMPAVLALAFMTAGLPTLISQYRNGRRYDFRGAAEWLAPQLTGRDVIFSDQPMVLAHYLKPATVQKLRQDPGAMQDSLAALSRGGGEAALWVVAPQPAHAFRTNLKAGGLADFLYGSCQLRNTVGRGRIDFRQQYLQVFRCPPAVRPSNGS
jgi:hypothetical protein